MPLWFELIPGGKLRQCRETSLWSRLRASGTFGMVHDWSSSRLPVERAPPVEMRQKKQTFPRSRKGTKIPSYRQKRPLLMPRTAVLPSPWRYVVYLSQSCSKGARTPFKCKSEGCDLPRDPLLGKGPICLEGRNLDFL